MKFVKFVVKMILTLMLIAFAGIGWYGALGSYYDRMQKVISAKRAWDNRTKCHPISYADISDEERKIVAKNTAKLVTSGWKWMIETA